MIKNCIESFYLHYQWPRFRNEFTLSVNNQLSFLQKYRLLANDALSILDILKIK